MFNNIHSCAHLRTHQGRLPKVRQCTRHTEAGSTSLPRCHSGTCTQHQGC